MEVKLSFSSRLLFILTAVVCNSFVSCSVINNETAQHRSTIKSATLDDLKQLPMADPPLESAQEAMSYAVNNQFVWSSLEEVVRKASFVSWDVTSQLIDQDNLSLWQVTVHSSGMLPSFTCKVSFTQEGDLIEDNLNDSYCNYNK